MSVAPDIISTKVQFKDGLPQRSYVTHLIFSRQINHNEAGSENVTIKTHLKYRRNMETDEKRACWHLSHKNIEKLFNKDVKSYLVGDILQKR